jgi:hypothetical protein
MDLLREVLGVFFAVFVAGVLIFAVFCIAVSFSFRFGGGRQNRSDPAGPGWTSSGDTEAETEADPDPDDEAARRAARQAAQEAEAG